MLHVNYVAQLICVHAFNVDTVYVLINSLPPVQYLCSLFQEYILQITFNIMARQQVIMGFWNIQRPYGILGYFCSYYRNN